MQAVEEEDTRTPHLSSDPGTNKERESSPEVTELSAIQNFSLALKSAQVNASVAEGQKKWLHQGKSERMICRHKRAKVLMEAKGSLSLPEFFKQKAEKVGRQETDAETTKGPEDGSKASTVPQTAPDKTEAALTAPTVSKLASAPVPMVAAMVLEALPMPAANVKVFKASLVALVFTTALEDREGAKEAEKEEDKEDEANVCMSRQSSRRTARLVLYESEESSSRCSSDATSDHEDLQGTNTWELKGNCQGNSPNNDAPEWPTDGAPELLQDCAVLQAAQAALSLVAR